ncbi:uncharacterized protein LOC143075583 [Mytilus galloprovincialis]|uniref:uncharacterized protein LOC143075583 n=1 Tax=Mytilus galloprovincialis TaxID=29158 RepID=UPI003F7BA3D3
MQLFFVICYLLVLLDDCIYGDQNALREKWKTGIKEGLMNGKHIVDLFSTEPMSKIFNQIHLLTNFIGTVDSLASFIQEFNSKTELEMFKELKQIFTDINKKLEQASDRRFGRDFRDIFFELRNIDFSFVILNRFLEKLEEFECTNKAECEVGLPLIIKLFKNDFDIGDYYSHILKATFNGTRFSKDSLVQQVKKTSGCDEKTIFNFGKHMLLKLFKAEQIMIVYGKLAKKHIDSTIQIYQWTNDIYELRRSLLRVVKECLSRDVCKSKCQNGKCIRLSESKRDICMCPKYYDGDNCQIRNQIVLVKDLVSVMSILNKVPKIGNMLDLKLAKNYMVSSMKCLSLAYETVQNVNNEVIDKHLLTATDLGSFYGTYLSMNYLILQASKIIPCDTSKINKIEKQKLLQIAYHLPIVLFKMNSFFNFHRVYDIFQPKSLLVTVIDRYKDDACSADYKSKIDNLWRQFHLAQSNGFSVLLQVRDALYKHSSPLVRLFKQRVKQQINFAMKSTCSASINHSSNVHCGELHLVKTMTLENKCIEGYVRDGNQYFTCQKVTSVCKPCNCNTTGSLSTICNSKTGECQCKEHFRGQTCEKEERQDCKWSDWTYWSVCSKACGIDGKQERSRHIVLPQKGQGKQCQGDRVEERTCFKRCCNGTFDCKDSSKCPIGIKCQPCNCDQKGSTKDICQPINGACSCKQNFHGRRCQEEFRPKDCSALDKKIHKSDVYKIFPDSGSGFKVYCDMDTDGGHWTVFQRRTNGTTDFNHGWTGYKNGFGDLNAEFWLGNDHIHRLTSGGKSSLRIDLRDLNGRIGYAKYQKFSIGDSSSEYKLTVSGYSGNAGDSLAYHNNIRFSTKDNDNDTIGRQNCAAAYTGGWWFGSCIISHLNGLFKGKGAQGISWYRWRNLHDTIQTSKMMIRNRKL